MKYQNFCHFLALLGALVLSSSALTACSFLGSLPDSLFGSSADPSASTTMGGDTKTTRSSRLAEGTSRTGADNATENTPQSSNQIPSDFPVDESKIVAVPGIEVTWKVPDPTSPAFVIYFGATPRELSSRVEVATGRLETFTDPTQGEVYRYVVSNVPASGPLFVAVASFDGVSEGARSEPLAVTAQ